MSKKSNKKTSKDSNIDISIIVTSYHNAAVLDLCLKSIIDEIKKLRKKDKLVSEIIVVDSEAGEKTRDVAKKYILDNELMTYCPFSKTSVFPNWSIKESKKAGEITF
jgi:glycosyltransferase involved in cell wall biosynthesis